MLRHPSWNGLDKPSSLDLYRDSASDIEEACCNRRRSHSHDLPDPWDRPRRWGLAGAACLCFVLGVAVVRGADASPRPPVFMEGGGRTPGGRVLLSDDDGSLHLSSSPASSLSSTGAANFAAAAADADGRAESAASRYDALLKSDFGPAHTTRESNASSTRKKSKSQLKREEKHAIAAEKRRLAQAALDAEAEAAAADERRRARAERKQATKLEKQQKREVIALQNGLALRSDQRR